MNIVPEAYRDLLADEKRAFAFLSTLMPDGSPQVTPVWFNTDGEYILINTACGRVKDRNMRRDSRVAMVIMDLTRPYHYLQIRGRVAAVTEEGAREHIDLLSLKYTGRENFRTNRPDEVRVIYKISPDNVTV